MKKIFSALILVLLLLAALTSCEADLSHKHFCDNFGVCKTCFEDVCNPLFGSTGKLSSGDVFAKDGEKLYFRFKPNGDGKTVITVRCGSAVMESSVIDFYTKSSYGLITTPLFSEDESIKKVRIDSALDKNETYYFSFTIKSRGTVIVEADCHISDM